MLATSSQLRRVALILAFAFLAVSVAAVAHPEDELCVPGESSLDPELCAALSDMDRADDGGRPMNPILDDTGAERGFSSTFGLYVTIGVRHILPGGLDHILFVLALFLSSTRVRALVIQVSTFTIAHTATLGLAAAGVLAMPAAIVEPLIAATIAFVAIENVLLPDMPSWRPLVVFLFGLVHGLGFAGFFGELGLPAGQFWSALIGFNVGVEVGQLSVVLVAWGVAWFVRSRLPAGEREQLFRRRVAVPASLLIGAVGVYWTVERIMAHAA